MAAARASSALRMAIPSGRRPAMISALAAATPSMEPNPPMWAWPIMRTPAASGGAMSVR